MNNVDKAAELTARLFLALIFLLSGLHKISQFEGTQAYMAAAGVPGILLPVVIALEVIGALALMLGWQTRLAALALATFTLLAALLFHNNFQDQMQMIMFMKNVAITGGLLLLFVNGAGSWSLDARRYSD